MCLSGIEVDDNGRISVDGISPECSSSVVFKLDIFNSSSAAAVLVMAVDGIPFYEGVVVTLDGEPVHPASMVPSFFFFLEKRKVI